jgi:hypothetical protein
MAMADDETGDEPTTEPTGKTYTQAELDAFLTRERDKLHGRLNKASTAQDAMKTELAELRTWQQDQQAAAKKLEDERAAAQRQAEEAELTAKQLIDKRTAEFAAEQQKLQDGWAAQVSGLQTQMQQQQAVFDKEREFQELANYTAAQVNAHVEEIAPELVRYIGKNCSTREEIDASIAEAIEATSSILAGIQGAQTAARAQMPGVSPAGFTPAGPIDAAQGGTKTFTAEQIAAMSTAEYAQYREAFGVTGNNVGTGRFGQLGKGLFG